MISEQQYHSLCDACDQLLMEPGSSIERVALPWLHVIREHPVFLETYASLFREEKDQLTRTGGMSYLFRLLVKQLAHLSKLILAKSRWWSSSHKQTERTEVIFVSHLLNVTQAGKDADFYFGILADKLYEQGIQSAFVLINHTRQPGRVLSATWKRANVPRFILADVLGFFSELGLYLNCLRESLHLSSYGKRTGDGLLKKVAFKAAHEASSGKAIHNLRIGRQVQRLVKNLRPKFVITTYEGHAWERVVFASARKGNPDIRCFGYQHAAIFRLQHAIRRNLSEQYNPDHIFTAGKVGLQQLGKSSRLGGISLDVLGSDRASVQNHLVSSSGLRKQPACLVIPEGLLSECLLLFNFSIACAKQFPDIYFIWRVHPVISFEEILHHVGPKKNLPSNIRLSTSLLEEDINCSVWALYRGSTAIIQSVNAGLIPLYLYTNEMVIDPLYEVNDKIFSISTVDDFSRIVNERDISETKLKQLERIRLYVNNFFAPVSYTSLIAKISKT